MSITDAERQTALRRLRKCLRLAASATIPGEVAAALRQAQILMRKYGLSVEDAELADIRELATSAGGGSSVAQWEASLADCVRDAFGVQVLFRHGAVGAAYWVFPKGKKPQKRHSRKHGEILFVGPEDRVTVALYAFDALRRQLRLARKQHATLSGQRGNALKSFCLGWALGVKSKLAALAAPFPIDAATLAHTAQRKNLSDRQAEVRGAMPKATAELVAYRYGLRAAQDAVLNAGVAGGANDLALPEKPRALVHAVDRDAPAENQGRSP